MQVSSYESCDSWVVLRIDYRQVSDVVQVIKNRSLKTIYFVRSTESGLGVSRTSLPDSEEQDQGEYEVDASSDYFGTKRLPMLGVCRALYAFDGKLLVPSLNFKATIVLPLGTSSQISIDRSNFFINLRNFETEEIRQIRK